MMLFEQTLQLSATDLVGHLSCRHLTQLDHAVAMGTLERPHVWDPHLEILRERGARHERGYIEHLETLGLDVVRIEGIGIDDAGVQMTLEAMRAGAPVIIQAALRAGGWGGRADVLRRVETASALGAWSYEPLDAKLARETRAAAVLQLCLYAELLEAAQGISPEHVYVVAPWTGYQPQAFRISDFSAYYRRVKRSLESALDEQPRAETYPDPNDYCEVCRWRSRCDEHRRGDDHLCLVAGITKVQINELQRRGVTTTTQLAALPLPLPWRPDRGARHSYERIREQARVQLHGRLTGVPQYEMILPVSAESGLSRLPEPTEGDIFLDLEGDPFVGESGLEYLFGYAWREEGSEECYRCHWALSREDERHAFQSFIDFVMQRLERWPRLHIYHFAPYEPAALRRLMGRYATREEEMDRLLRGQVFVDLYAITRHGVRASVESYSIKQLEPLYRFVRETPLQDANRALTKLQTCLEFGDRGTVAAEDCAMIERYNRDDCISAWRLRDWLEERRHDLIAAGLPIQRPVPIASEPSANVTAWLARIDPVIARLSQDVPEDPSERSSDQHARWLLAHMLDWHRREQKAVWWDYFRLADLTAENLLEERVALSGLEFIGPRGGTPRAPIHRYQFPPQETELRGGEELRVCGGVKLGSVHDISHEERWVDIKKRGDSVAVHPEAVFAHKIIGADVMAESLLRLGEYVAAHGVSGRGPHQAARDLLLREPPRDEGLHLRTAEEDSVAVALRLAGTLPEGVLPIQGPPGAGKTYTGARMICRLVQNGRRVVITANSHKVIRHLIDAVLATADELGINLNCLQKPAELEDDLPRLKFTTDNAVVFGSIGQSCHVAGGTAWLWARPEAFEAADVLVVDEAAQMSLANVLAVSQVARSVILLGDPQQLDQPMLGSHPEGTDISALSHLLVNQQTIPPDRGIFLGETWRLHPRICSFTSELFYEGRLRPKPRLERQEIRGAGFLSGSGLRLLTVTHEGNQNSSPEEADLVQEVVQAALADNPTWIDADGVEHPLTTQNILIMAPYNAQVFDLQERLPGLRVGTVDKFQGQEAPLVVYSMTTSTHADAPRGMEFLYSLNRLNVATSRAKCVCLLVASPALLAADCRTPRQMQLVNAYCRYVELAEPIVV